MIRSGQPMWGSLTSEMDVVDGAARRFFAGAFPAWRSTSRTVMAAYRDGVGLIKVPGGQANPGTIGTAFDLWVQLQATARPDLGVASLGAILAGGDLHDAYRELGSLLGTEHVPQPLPGLWHGPSAALSERDLLRLCWAAALFVEVYRTGLLMDGSPLAGRAPRRGEDLLGLATPAALGELSDLAELARQRLLPRLHALAEDGPTWLSPTFAGSRPMAADADLIVGHTLVEIKTSLGTKTTRGRSASLSGLLLYQLLGYVLHDHDDAHQLTHLALYQARYGHLALWRIDRLLHELADQPVDLPTLRARWADLLAGGEQVVTG